MSNRFSPFTPQEKRILLTALGQIIREDRITIDAKYGINYDLISALFEECPDPDTYDSPEIGKYDIYIR